MLWAVQPLVFWALCLLPLVSLAGSSQAPHYQIKGEYRGWLVLDEMRIPSTLVIDYHDQTGYTFTSTSTSTSEDEEPLFVIAGTCYATLVRDSVCSGMDLGLLDTVKFTGRLTSARYVGKLLLYLAHNTSSTPDIQGTFHFQKEPVSPLESVNRGKEI